MRRRWCLALVVVGLARGVVLVVVGLEGGGGLRLKILLW